MAQTENYIEYAQSGAVIKGQERAKVKSRYEEDVLINNHTVRVVLRFDWNFVDLTKLLIVSCLQSVWGSYWEGGSWGYACCHSFIRNSFCAGEAGKKARQVSC